MDTCDVIFVVEGIAVIPVLRSCLVRLFNAQEEGVLRIQSPSQAQREVERSKYRVGEKVVGLFNAGEKDQTYSATRYFVELSLGGRLLQLRHVVLVRDLDDKTSEALDENLIRRMDNLTRSEGVEFSRLHSTPVLGQFDNVTISQVLPGDPTFGSREQHTVEDHVIQFLQQQESRDPSELTGVVECHLGKALGLKQRVQLAMVMDGYWSGPRGFYERVVEGGSDESLEALAETIGITQVMEAIDA